MNGTLRILASQANGRSTSRHFSVKINLADFRFESNSGCKKLARDLRMSSQEVEGVMPDIHFGRSYTQNGISAIFSFSISVSFEAPFSILGSSQQFSGPRIKVHFAQSRSEKNKGNRSVITYMQYILCAMMLHFLFFT